MGEKVYTSQVQRRKKLLAVIRVASIVRFALTRIGCGEIISTSANKRKNLEDIKRLLARTPVIRSGCDLDLLVFLYRHPRALLTSEQIAAFVGRDMKMVAEALDAFIAAGLVDRLHNSTHAARLYLLAVHDPEDKNLKRLLELASTRQGRHEILATLNSGSSHTQGDAKHLQLVKGACA